MLGRTTDEIPAEGKANSNELQKSSPYMVSISLLGEKNESKNHTNVHIRILRQYTVCGICMMDFSNKIILRKLVQLSYYTIKLKDIRVNSG